MHEVQSICFFDQTCKLCMDLHICILTHAYLFVITFSSVYLSCWMNKATPIVRNIHVMWIILCFLSELFTIPYYVLYMFYSKSSLFTITLWLSIVLQKLWFSIGVHALQDCCWVLVLMHYKDCGWVLVLKQYKSVVEYWCSCTTKILVEYWCLSSTRVWLNIGVHALQDCGWVLVLLKHYKAVVEYWCLCTTKTVVEYRCLCTTKTVVEYWCLCTTKTVVEYWYGWVNLVIE